MSTLVKTKHLVHCYDAFLNDNCAMVKICQARCPSSNTKILCQKIRAAKNSLEQLQSSNTADVQKIIRAIQTCLLQGGRVTKQLLERHQDPRNHVYEFLENNASEFKIIMTAPP